MTGLYKYIVGLLFCMSFTALAEAQSYQRYGNSLRIQYGVFQYNSNKSEFIKEGNNNFLSGGITYRRQLGRLSGLNLAAKYYQWKLIDSSELSSYAAQIMYVLHAGRISKNWKLNRITPYAGFGIGIQQHHLKNATGLDSVFNKLYIPFEVGILYNISPRWSLGVFGEYKLSTSSDIKNLSSTSQGKMDIVNSAGVVLAWHFGKKTRKKTYSPVIFTNPSLAPVINKTTNADNVDTVVVFKKIIKKEKERVKNYESKKELKQLKDSTRKLIAVSQDSHATLPDTGATKIKAGTKVKTTKIADSSVLKTDSLIKKKKQTVIEKSGKLAVDSINVNAGENEPIEKVAVDSPFNKMADKPKQKPAADKAGEIEAKRSDLVKKNTEESDSLNTRTNELNGQIKTLRQEINTKQSGIGDNIVLQPIEIKSTDNASVRKLKNAYNKLNQKIETNYWEGRMKELEFEKMKTESEKLKNKISLLAEENDIAFEELEVLFNRVNDLQTDLDIEKEKRNYAAIETVPGSKVDLQRQLDSALSELKKNKQIQAPDKKVVAVKIKKEPVKKVPEITAVDEPEPEKAKESVKAVSKTAAVTKATPSKAKEIKALYTAPKVKRDVANIDLSKSVEVYTVLFDLNSSTINPFYIKELVKTLNNNVPEGEAYILLSGYTDKSGNVALNNKLSQNRISAVKRTLINAGVPSELIEENNVGSEEATGFVSQNDRKVIIRLINN